MKQSASLQPNDQVVRSTQARGRLVATLLAGAWRAAPSAPAISALELEAVGPLLLKSGAAGLGWCKIRGSELGTSSAGHQLHQAYRLQSLQVALHERSLKRIIPLLRCAGVEPLLVKGWAIARLYHEPAVRPYIDLDLCVLPAQYEAANAVLKDPEAEGCNVDLHAGFGKFSERQTDEVFSRSRLVKLGDLDVRVLSAEDDLRFLCMHMLRHGAMFPLWLCDIALSLERCSTEFDWDRCLSGSRRNADWIACAIGLAHQLLGVNVERTPVASRAENLPAWLLSAVLTRWGSLPQTRFQIAPLFNQPKRIIADLIAELPRHWPNPIEASIAFGAPFNRAPRLPLQVGHVISRVAGLLMQSLGLQRDSIQQKG